MHAGDGHITAGLAAGNKALHAVDRASHLNRVDAHAENVESGTVELRL
jgi:hypothetical protein